MARLYDEMRRMGYSNLGGYTIIDCQNVADYVYANQKEIAPSLLCVMPPFDRMWIEYRLYAGVIKQKVGLQIISEHTDGEPILVAPKGTKPTDSAADVKYSFANRHWRLRLFSYLQRIGQDQVDEWEQWFIDIGERGEIIQASFRHPMFEKDFINLERYELDETEDTGGFPAIPGIGLLALTFMNARNTVLIDNPPPAKLSKRHEKKYGVPLVTYKTLKVLPMRKVNQNDYDPASDSDTSIPKSLHIARGHFKDYRNGPGLFGKYKDIFWWDAHVRGSAESGVVVKDYDVIAPEES